MSNEIDKDAEIKKLKQTLFDVASMLCENSAKDAVRWDSNLIGAYEKDGFTVSVDIIEVKHQLDEANATILSQQLAMKQMREAVMFILPLAKGYVYNHTVGANMEMIEKAEKVLLLTIDESLLNAHDEAIRKSEREKCKLIIANTEYLDIAYRKIGELK